MTRRRCSSAHRRHLAGTTVVHQARRRSTVSMATGSGSRPRRSRASPSFRSRARRCCVATKPTRDWPPLTRSPSCPLRFSTIAVDTCSCYGVSGRG